MTQTQHRNPRRPASLPALPSVPDIEAMDRDALVALWLQVVGRPVPRNISQPLLRRFLAWEVQVAAQGGMSVREMEQMARLASSKARRPSPQMAAGTRYLREWNGVKIGRAHV